MTMYLLDTSELSSDSGAWSFLQLFYNYASRVFVWLTALCASVKHPLNGWSEEAHGAIVPYEYLLGLGTCGPSCITES